MPYGIQTLNAYAEAGSDFLDLFPSPFDCLSDFIRPLDDWFFSQTLYKAFNKKLNIVGSIVKAGESVKSRGTDFLDLSTSTFDNLSDFSRPLDDWFVSQTLYKAFNKSRSQSSTVKASVQSKRKCASCALMGKGIVLPKIQESPSPIESATIEEIKERYYTEEWIASIVTSVVTSASPSTENKVARKKSLAPEAKRAVVERKFLRRTAMMPVKSPTTGIVSITHASESKDLNVKSSEKEGSMAEGQSVVLEKESLLAEEPMSPAEEQSPLAREESNVSERMNSYAAKGSVVEPKGAFVPKKTSVASLNGVRGSMESLKSSLRTDERSAKSHRGIFLAKKRVITTREGKVRSLVPEGRGGTECPMTEKRSESTVIEVVQQEYYTYMF